MFTDVPTNPYTPDTPIHDPTRFFGREDVFAFIRQQLVVERGSQAIVLVGQHGIGKTSLLLQLPYQLDSRTLVTYIDLSTIPYGEPGGLLSVMADSVHAMLDLMGISSHHLPPTPENATAAALETWFAETYLEVTLAALGGNRRLLFAFDELTALFDAIDRRDVSADILDYLSRLLARDQQI